MPTLKRILVIGATGHFGERISRRLIGEPNTELVVTSRSSSKAGQLAKELSRLNSSYPITAFAIDCHSPDFEAELQNISPDIVIHTAGPYQGQDYRVANACIAIGSHYIDLADGRQFVEEFHQANHAATAANVLAISGASTLPALSSAVFNTFKTEFESVESIRMSIAPGHQTPRGVSTISAVLSYCGKPFNMLENGSPVKKFGWQDLTWQHYPKLGRRLSAACDVPDLSLLPKHIPTLKTVSFHASLEAKWEQLGLWCMSGLSRIGLVKSWNRAIPLFDFISERLIKLGSDRGGMHMEISGQGSDGQPKTLTWYVHAENNHGPEIPCTPAVILARKLAQEKISLVGAVPCLELFSLEDFDQEIAKFDVSWEVKRE